MGSAYEVRPVPIGRPARRWPIVVVIAAGVSLAAVVTKPWSWWSATPPPPVAVADRPAEVASAAPGPVASRPPSTIGSLAVHGGTWGVGVAGLGPRYDADPWTDWAAVDPEPATGYPGRIPIWPGTGVCSGIPVLLDGPLFFAITNPVDLPVDRRVVGWWSDGGRTASLDGTFRQITPIGDRGVSYVVRLDRAVWPAGRYEFHVETGERTFGLTVCLPGPT